MPVLFLLLFCKPNNSPFFFYGRKKALFQEGELLGKIFSFLLFKCFKANVWPSSVSEVLGVLWEGPVSLSPSGLASCPCTLPYPSLRDEERISALSDTLLKDTCSFI